MRRAVAAIGVAASLVGAIGPVVAADLGPEAAANAVVSAWLVRVEGEPKTRTLIVKGAEKGLGGSATLDADYGLTESGQSKVKSELALRDNAYVLEFVTQAGTVVTLRGVGSDEMSGTFKYSNGKVSPVTLSRLSPEAFERVSMEAVGRRVMVASPNAPAACSGLLGGWLGTWTQGSRNTARLWVVEADASCNVKYSQERSPRGFAVANASGGSLSFVCNSSTGGTCVFKRSGDEMYANYSNLQGGINAAVLKRVNAEIK